MFDHSEVTLTEDFDKILRGPGFWKFNNSHLQSERFKEIVKIELVKIVHEYQTNDTEQKELIELIELSPQQRQELEIRLNPHELMEQIRYILKARTIKYSIAIQRQRTYDKKQTEIEIKDMNEELQSGTLNQDDRRKTQRKLVEKEAAFEKMEEHLAKGTSVRSRQEWDINGEGPGKILLKCEEKCGQQKYMQSIITIN